MNLSETLRKARLIPVIVIEDANDAVPLAQALVRGGLPVIEVTFRTDAAAEAIAQIHREVPDAVLGAGTVLTQDQLISAKNSGAAFAVSPGLDPDLLDEARKLEMPFIPGIATASELTLALKKGTKMVKFFPAEAAGGVKMLKALGAAFGHAGVQFMPTGGVNEKNLADYLNLKSVAAAGGSWIAEKPLIQARDWAEIERRARVAVQSFPSA